MKRKLLILLAQILLACLIALTFSACSSSAPPDKQTITGITFTSATYDYDGAEKELLVSGTLPEGVSVSYTNNSATNAGQYNATAVLSGDGYNTLTLNATLTINKIYYDMSGAQWNYTTAFTYDGAEKSVSVINLPQGVTTKTYTNNKMTDAGDYFASVTFNYDTVNYHAPTIPNCSWTIDKATITNVSFTGPTSVEYDTNPHSLTLTGIGIPEGANVTYTYNGNSVNSVTEVGTYKVIAIITCKNYYDFTISETLKITSTEKQLYSINHNGTIYFQNNLDGDKLYTVNGTNVKKVNNDTPSYMISDGTNVYYFSKSLLGSSIKQLNTVADKLFNLSGEYLATDGTYLYYAVNNTLINTDENGIYKIAIDSSAEEEPTPMKICSEKAKYLVYYDGYIYYANASANDHLYRVSVNATNATGSLLWEEKVEYIICDNGVLFFNSSNTVLGVSVASAVYKYVISSNSAIKLTTDNGKYITKVGSFVYYVNVDALTSSLFGKGIYRVSANGSSDSSLPGTKIIEAEDNGFSSLTSDGTNLYYYKLNDKHFYSYNISSSSEADLMENFVVETTTSISGFAQIAEHNGELYYINTLDNGYLYKFNPTTKSNFKVLEDSISGVYFNENYMYYSTYILSNFALWKMDLTTYETTKISSDRCDRLIFDQNYIYYIKTGSAYNNYIYKMGLDGSSPTKLFDTTLWVSDFFKEGNYIYCVANAGLLGNNDKIYKFDTTTNTATEYDFESTAFTVNNGVIYYYDHNNDTLNIFNGSASTTIATNVVVNDLIVMNNKLYYSSTGKASGLFVYDFSTQSTNKLSENNAETFYVYNNTLYFMQTAISYSNDYPICGGVSTNDGCLYSLNGETITRLN